MTEQNFTDEEKAQIQAKWLEVEKMFKDRGVHDICLRVLAMLLNDDGLTFRDQWTPEIAKAWWEMMDAAKTERTHRTALDDQLMLAAYMQQKLRKPDLAGGLIILINECVLRWKLVDLDVDAAFEKEKAAAGSEAVTGGKARPVPAKVGDKPPEGAVRPDQLGKGPRRI